MLIAFKIQQGLPSVFTNLPNLTNKVQKRADIHRIKFINKVINLPFFE